MTDSQQHYVNELNALLAEDPSLLAYEDVPEGYRFVESKVIDDGGRWYDLMLTVIQHIETGYYFGNEWESGKTEYQDDDFLDPTVFPVYPREVVSIEYRKGGE